MLSSGRYLVFAATASKSDADIEGVGAKDFVYNFVPLKNVSTGLKASGGTVTAVGNTIDSSLVVGTCRAGETGSTAISGSKKYLGTGGSYSYISESSNIYMITFDIPRDALPTSGSYMFSYSFNAQTTLDIKDVYIWVYKSGANAATGQQRLENARPNIINNAGEFKLDPILIDFRNISSMQIAVRLNTKVDAVGGNLHIRYEISSQDGGESVGFQNSTETNVADIAEATQNLVYTQNETNGKLDDIIRHISDQLAAMWDQIYNLMAVPWIQNDNARTQRTISAIEDVDVTIEESTDTLEQKTEWHANFIIEGLKSLFIPSDTYFQDTINSLMTWFNDRLGFLGYTLTYLIRLLNGILNAPQNPVIRFPGIHAPNRATNEDYVLLPAMDVNLAEQISMISEGSFNLLEFLRTAGDIVLVLAFIVLLQDKLHEVES